MDMESDTMHKGRMNHQSVFILVAAFFLMVCFFASSYSLNNPDKYTKEYNYFNTENLEFSYVDHGLGNGDVLSLVGTNPISDLDAVKQDGYRFSVTNISNTAHKYRIRLVEDIAVINEDACSSKLLYSNHIKYQFDNNSPKGLSSIENNGYVLYESMDSILPGNSEIHELKIWLDEDTPRNLKDHYHGRIVIEEIDGLKYDSFDAGQILVLGESQKYLVLENSGSENAYLTLYPIAPLNYVGLEIDEKSKAFEATMDSIDDLLNNYRVQIRYLLGKEVDLNVLRVRMLTIEEYQKYFNGIQTLSQNKDRHLLYNIEEGKLKVYNDALIEVKNQDSGLFQPLVILHKDLLNQTEE